MAQYWFYCVAYARERLKTYREGGGDLQNKKLVTTAITWLVEHWKEQVQGRLDQAAPHLWG